MGEQPTEQPKSTIDQKGQNIAGNQTNVAGNLYVAPSESSQWRPYLFLFAVLALVALVVVYKLQTNNVSTSALPIFSGAAGTPSPSAQPLQPAATLTVTATLETAQISHCLQTYAASFPAQNRVILEEGLRDYDIPLNQNELLVIQITKNKEPVGLLHLLLFSKEKSFKVEKVLDATCDTVTSAANKTLSNWEAFEFSINGQSYVIRMGYQGDHLRIATLRDI